MNLVMQASVRFLFFLVIWVMWTGLQGCQGPSTVRPRLPPPPRASSLPVVEVPHVMPDDPTVPIAEALADGFETRYALRTHVLGIFRASWVRGGRPMARPDDQDRKADRDRKQMVVLERHPESVRVVFEDSTVRLTAFFPLRSLQPTPILPVKLLQIGEDTASQTGIIVFPAINARWKRLDQNGPWQLTHRERGIRFQGRLPASAVTWVFDKDILKREVPLHTHFIRNHTVIRDAPDGNEVARIHEGEEPEWIRGVRFLKLEKTDVLVVLETRSLRIQGWVKKNQILEASHSSSSVDGGSAGGGWGGSRLIMLEAATPLHACPNGPQVGVVRRQTRFIDEGVSAKGFRQIRGYGTSLHFWYAVCVPEGS